MSTALAVCHGSFGRVTIYRLDKPMRTHAHREGHLTFHLGAPPAIVTISNVPVRVVLFGVARIRGQISDVYCFLGRQHVTTS